MFCFFEVVVWDGETEQTWSISSSRQSRHTNHTNHYPVEKFMLNNSTIKFDIGGKGTATKCSW